MNDRIRQRVREWAVLLALVAQLLTTSPAMAQSGSVGTSISVTSTCSDVAPSSVWMMYLARGLFAFPHRDPDDPGHSTRIAGDGVAVPQRLAVDANDCVHGWSLVATPTDLVTATGNVLQIRDHLRINRTTSVPGGCTGPETWCLGTTGSAGTNAPDTWTTLQHGTPMLFEDLFGPPAKVIGGGTQTAAVSMWIVLRLASLPATLPAGTYTGTMTFTLTTVEP